jgi:hypothetical protein
MLYSLREQRLFIQSQADALETTEKALKEHIINTLPKSKTTGVAGRLARVRVGTDTVPTVKDWKALHAHILKTKDWELLGRTIGRAAIEERWEHGKKVPGVEPFPVVKVYCNKL